MSEKMLSPKELNQIQDKHLSKERQDQTNAREWLLKSSNVEESLSLTEKEIENREKEIKKLQGELETLYKAKEKLGEYVTHKKEIGGVE